MNMGKVLAVALREYLATVKTRAFLVAVLAMPVLMLGAMVIPAWLEQEISSSEKRCTVVDHSGVMFERLAERASGTPYELAEMVPAEPALQDAQLRKSLK